MRLGVSALTGVELSNIGIEKEVSVATLWAATIWHRHTESLSGILINQYLPHPCLLKGGRGVERAKKACNEDCKRA